MMGECDMPVPITPGVGVPSYCSEATHAQGWGGRWDNAHCPGLCCRWVGVCGSMLVPITYIKQSVTVSTMGGGQQQKTSKKMMCQRHINSNKQISVCMTCHVMALQDMGLKASEVSMA